MGRGLGVQNEYHMNLKRGCMVLLLFIFAPKISFAKLQLEGVFPTILTPLSSQGVINGAALREEIDFVMNNGASGIFLLGSIGEGHYLPIDLREGVIRIAKEALGSRGKLIVNISSFDTNTAIAHAAQAKRLGADFLSVQIPTFYEIKLESVLKHIQKLVEIGLPVLYYDYQEATNLVLNENQMEEVLLTEGVVGAKITSLQFPGVRDLVHRVLQVKPDLALFTGTVFNLKWFLDLGGAGVIDPVSLFEPEAASRLIAKYREAYRSGRGRRRELLGEVDSLQGYLDGYLPFFQNAWSDPVILSNFLNSVGKIFGVEIGRVSYHSRSKYLLNRRGFLMPVVVSEPLPQLSAKDVEIVSALERYLPGIAATHNLSLGSRAPLPLVASEPPQHLRGPSQLKPFQLVKRQRSSPVLNLIRHRRQAGKKFLPRFQGREV